MQETQTIHEREARLHDARRWLEQIVPWMLPHERENEFDMEHWVSMVAELSAELEMLPVDEQRDRYTTWLFDVLPVDTLEHDVGNPTPSALFEQFGCEPIRTEFHRQKNGPVSVKALSQYAQHDQRSYLEPYMMREFLYGPARLFDVQPGEYVTIDEPGTFDIVSSSRFSECVGIVIRNAGGIELAHVVSREEGVREFFDRRLSQGDVGDVVYVRPEAKLDGSFRYANEFNMSHAAVVEELQDQGVSLHEMRYPYWGTSGRPAGVKDYTILATQEGVRLVGVGREQSVIDKKRYIVKTPVDGVHEDFSW